jgi:hypothetical protein
VPFGGYSGTVAKVLLKRLSRLRDDIAADAAHAGVDEPALRGVQGVLEGVLPALGRRALESAGRGGAGGDAFRREPVDADQAGCGAAVSGVAVSRDDAGRGARPGAGHPFGPGSGYASAKLKSGNLIKYILK